MKTLMIISTLIFSFTACSRESKETKQAKKEIESSKKIENAKAADAPCDSKEDVLKKLEEKKKAQEEKGKGFSLQGGNTGCSVK